MHEASLKLVGVAAAVFLWSSVAQAQTIIPVEPGDASTITDAVAAAEPGDIIQLAPGTYRGSVVIRRSGEPERPIVIESADPENPAVIDGGASPGTGDDYGILFEGASWITVRDVAFENAWRNVLVLRDSSYISVQRCDFRDTGQHALAAYGSTHHVLAEECTWTQDERIWTEWSWDELHHGSLEHYNGGFYGGGDAYGGAVIRRNSISYVFNGLRWWFRGSERQTNLDIYENEFRYVLDNMIEPETYVWNMHAYHNVMSGCASAPWSIQGGVYGGHILLYGNTGRWTPEEPNANGKSPWTVYKLESAGSGRLSEPMGVYHNAMDYGTVISSNRGQDHLYHLNNAYPDSLGMRDFEGSDTRFDHDCVESFGNAPGEENGIEADPQFEDADGENFRLSSSSPCIDNGAVLEGTLWYLGSAPDMGAYEGSQRVALAPIRHMDPPGGALYEERPRIARIFAYGHLLAVFYTVDLEPGGVTASDVELSLGDSTVAVGEVTFPTAAPRVMVLRVGTELAHGDEVGLALAALPQGTNGQPATMWGADLKISGVPREATLAGELASALEGLDPDVAAEGGVTPPPGGGGGGDVSTPDGGAPEPGTGGTPSSSDPGVDPGPGDRTMSGGCRAVPSARGAGLPAALAFLAVSALCWRRRRG